ncbi:Rho GTPase activation protein [Cantharellus anzutake]|uniref:Rho GTPase activation protein n=1 Tax=Cantharellus anzutake TaxID=1750568 RepID=UPI00190618E9|nr:Rho GTPase activation protein [Cantharellus anzutake]KAF8340603.1 Rho GTPase activation protein [Cantharellus anzutake]
MAQRDRSQSPPSKANLKAWWKSFTTSQRFKQHAGQPERDAPIASGKVFGVPLRESLRYANVQISTASGGTNGEVYVYGYVPVVVAKCGLYLKEGATEVEGVFRVNGSAKRMRELQAAFETPPRYGKDLDWRKESYRPHDIASVLRRYLTQMPEPVIPHKLYHKFRDAYSEKPLDVEKVISEFKALIHSMPRGNQYLLLYVLDLLSVFSRKSDKNLMTAQNLAVIFRPGIISHPDQELSPEQHKLSQAVLEFLIEYQDHFILEIPPPPRNDSVLVTPPPPVNPDLCVIPSESEDETTTNRWKLVERTRQGRVGIRSNSTRMSSLSSIFIDGSKPCRGPPRNHDLLMIWLLPKPISVGG